MDKVQVILTKEQQRNLLIMLDSVQINGIQSASEYLNIFYLIQNATELELNNTDPDQVKRLSRT